MDSDTFIFFLEAVADIETETASRSCQNLEQLAFKQGSRAFIKHAILLRAWKKV
jgi:hypothetical protein